MSVEKKMLPEKHGVVFALWDGKHIQLEIRTKEDEFKGMIIIPGGKVKKHQTLQNTLFDEVKQEYGISVKRYKKLGTYPNIENNGMLNIRHLYLVTEWEGRLSNPENKSTHIKATLEEALRICEHPLTQIFLKVIDKELSRQD
jgi:ADP-ribose pyrophosphatase YjhB (NUDIX family)